MELSPLMQKLALTYRQQRPIWLGDESIGSREHPDLGKSPPWPSLARNRRLLARLSLATIGRIVCRVLARWSGRVIRLTFLPFKAATWDSSKGCKLHM